MRSLLASVTSKVAVAARTAVPRTVASARVARAVSRASPARSVHTVARGLNPQLVAPSSTLQRSPSLGLAAEHKEFMTVFHHLRTDIVDDLTSTYHIPASLQDYIDNMIQYNVPRGKLNRGLTVVSTVRTLKGGRLDDDEYFRAAVLGWCVEFMQGFLLVADDIMDSSLTRRGVPCWFRNPNIGMDAVNDAFILEAFVYRILKKHLRKDRAYLDVIELLQEVTYRTELGQLMDLKTAPPGNVDLRRFTAERYNHIVEYKTAYYSFYLPVALGLAMHGVTDPAVLERSRKILVQMGHYFQAQDDVLDCFGNPEVSGKIGTDIQDNKCTWLVVRALARASPSQLLALERNYGRKDASFVEAVKSIYKDLNLEREFESFEDSCIADIRAQIEAFTDFDRGVFTTLLDKIAQRKK